MVQLTAADWVVSCAGATRTDDPWQHYNLHVLGTLGILSAVARHTPDARVLLVGSAAEYGMVSSEDLPIREDHPAKPLTPFAASKLSQTRLAEAWCREHKLRVATVRPFNLLGPGLPECYFAAAVARRLLRLRSTVSPGPFPVANLTATRDFVDVRDAARAIAAILERANLNHREMEIYNIASGVETPLQEVAAVLGRLAGGYLPTDGGWETSRGGSSRSCGDATRLRQATGWSPRWAWPESVTALWTQLLETDGQRT